MRGRTSSPGRSLWIRVGIGSTAALVSVLAIPVPAPAPARVGDASAFALGAVVGVVLFVTLARAWPRRPGTDHLT
ncbi:MAG: hypothetical protein ACXWZP_02665, partial [Gaiellaceae bacterium]